MGEGWVGMGMCGLGGTMTCGGVVP
jgi:hypothetical protein